MSFKRYVIQLEDGEFVKHIHWIAGGTIPASVVPNTFDKALIVSEDYLNFIDDSVEKSRKDLLQDRFPGIKLVPVVVSLMDSIPS